MPTLWRRFLVLAGWTFWLGGLTFYGGVVIPVGRRLLGAQQSLVTRHVTLYLQLAGLLAIALLAWDCLVVGVRCSRSRLLVGSSWLVAWGLLWPLHARLSAMMDEAGTAAASGFYGIHWLYMLLSTLQWGLGVWMLWQALRTWQAEDGKWEKPGGI